jgi:hypothetical protein
MEERLKKLKDTALRKIEGAAKSGNSSVIIKNAEVLKKTELLIRDFNQIKSQIITLEEQTNSSPDLGGADSKAKEKSGSEAIQKEVSPRISGETTDDQVRNLKVDIDTQLKDFFSEPSLEESKKAE